MGLACGCRFEGFGFVVSVIVFDHAVDDACEFMRGGYDAFGFSEPRFEPSAELPDFVVVARHALRCQPHRGRDARRRRRPRAKQHRRVCRGRGIARAFG